MSSYLNGHALWLNNMDFVPVSTPDMFVSYHSHTPDGVMGLPQIQQVIVLQVPLTIYVKKTTVSKVAHTSTCVLIKRNCSIEGCHHLLAK